MATLTKIQRLEETFPEADQQVSKPFSEPTPDSDFILLVEEQKLHVNKAVLSLASPVFKTMFDADFKERSSEKVALPGKTFANMLEFLICIYPSTYNPVTRENLDAVLPLAHEYQVKQLVDRCEEFVLNQFQMEKEELKNPPLEELVHFLFLAEKYDLNRLHKECIEKMAARKCTNYRFEYGGYKEAAEKYKEFRVLSYKTKFEILQTRMKRLEPLAYEIASGYDKKENLKVTCFGFDN